MKRHLPILYFVFCCLGSDAQAARLDLYYGIDQFTLTETHRIQLDSIITNLDTNYNYVVSLEGSADYLGPQGYNLALSRRRVDEIANYIGTHHGLLVDSMEIKALGELAATRRADPGGGIKEHRAVRVFFWFEGPGIKTLEEEIAEARLGDHIILRNLNFIGGRHYLLRESVPELKSLLAVLQNNPELEIEIQGHVCCVDPERMPDGYDIDEKNYRLSINRARNIYEYLIKHGIDEKRLSYRGFGGSRKLVMPENSDEARTANRRVEIVILDGR